MKELSFPGLDLYNLYHLILMFFFASLRISSFLLSAPFFSTSFFTLQIRIVMAISITIFIFPEINILNQIFFVTFFILLSSPINYHYSRLIWINIFVHYKNDFL